MQSVSTGAVLVTVLAVACLCSGRLIAVGDSDRPRFIGCQTSQECGKGACCVVGMSRFSSPQCVPRRDLGQECRPGSEPVTTTLHYPNGDSVDMADVYFIHCPCQEGLRCDGTGDASPVCVDDGPTNVLQPADARAEFSWY